LEECRIHRLVADVALLARDRVLFVKYRDVAKYDGQRGWFVPDDFLSHGEHPEHTAKRIARDQVGIELSDARLSSIESFGNGAWHLVFHYVTWLEEVPAITPGANVEAHEWFRFDDLPPSSDTAHDGWTLEIVEGALASRP
jgi:ADP-ribose pyrophosphatase YjhB (NUDIX family)